MPIVSLQRRRSCGLSLVELLVGLAVASVALLGASTIWQRYQDTVVASRAMVDAKATNSLLLKQIRMRMLNRVAMDETKKPLVWTHKGSWGGVWLTSTSSSGSSYLSNVAEFYENRNGNVLSPVKISNLCRSGSAVQAAAMTAAKPLTECAPCPAGKLPFVRLTYGTKTLDFPPKAGDVLATQACFVTAVNPTVVAAFTVATSIDVTVGSLAKSISGTRVERYRVNIPLFQVKDPGVQIVY